MTILKEPIESNCDSCNGTYMYDGKSIDPINNNGTNCPYCGKINTFSLHIQEKYS